MEKLWSLGVLGAAAEQGRLSDVPNKVTVAAFCRRRLAVVMFRTLKMCETVKAVSFGLPLLIYRGARGGGGGLIA